MSGDFWKTPEGLKRAIYNTFNEGQEMFDPCPVNPTFNGLEIDWYHKNFVNPPYGRGEQVKWIKKAHFESFGGRTSYLLLPADTSTIHWHFMMKTAHSIYFFDKRIRFVGASGSPKFGSALVIYNDSWVTFRGPVCQSIHWDKKNDKLIIAWR